MTSRIVVALLIAFVALTVSVEALTASGSGSSLNAPEGVCFMSLEDMTMRDKKQLNDMASKKCESVKEDKVCFAQCKALHLVQLAPLCDKKQTKVCQSICEAVNSQCSSSSILSFDQIAKAGLAECSLLPEENCVTDLSLNGKPVPVMSKAQVASTCSSFTKIMPQKSYATVFNHLPLRKLPVKSLTNQYCTSNGCFSANETAAFSCLKAGIGGLEPIECDIAYRDRLFATCPLGATIDAHCTSLSCCLSVNQQLFKDVSYYTRRYATQYTMNFTNAAGQPIKCQSFENNPTNKCVQQLLILGSSTWKFCLNGEKWFNAINGNPVSRSNDDLSFTLF